MMLLNKKVLFKRRIRGTFLFIIANFSTQEIYEIYFQFSLKDPWWLPKYKPELGESKKPLYGWLFFYFGRFSIGVIVPASVGEKPTVKKPIYDFKGQLWNGYKLKDRQMEIDFRRIIKKYKVDVSVEIKEDERTIVNQIIRRRIFGL